MKKMYLILGLFITTSLLVSCSKDDDNGNEMLEINEANLIGTWELTKFVENGETIQPETCDTYFATYSKTSNGENLVVYLEGYEDQNGKCATSLSTDYTWSLSSGNILSTEVLATGGDQDMVKIVELTTTTLMIEYSYEEGNTTYLILETYTKK